MGDILHNSDDNPNLLGTNRNDGPRLNAYYDRPDDNWNANNGFAFAVPATLLFFLS